MKYLFLTIVFLIGISQLAVAQVSLRYDRNCGCGYLTNQSGSQTFTGWRKTWTSVIPIETFHAARVKRYLFYEGSTGHAEVYDFPFTGKGFQSAWNISGAPVGFTYLARDGSVAPHARIRFSQPGEHGTFYFVLDMNNFTLYQTTSMLQGPE